MNKQKAVFLLSLLVLIPAASSLPFAAVPRKSPEFALHESSGKTILLSSLAGKVVVMEFLFIKSEHCLRVATTLNKLYRELGPRGFQPVGVVFDPPSASSAGPAFVAYMVDYFKLTYPVSYSGKKDVDDYLGRAQNEILNIPQVVVIDRNGMIRATSGSKGGDPRLEDENSLRNLIDALLQERVTVGSSDK